MADDTVIVENEHGRAVISPFAGATLRSLNVTTPSGRRELISGGEGPHDPRHVKSGTGSFLMAPWPNRIRDGALYSGGRVAHRLPVTSGRHAMHGTVRGRVWSPLAVGRAEGDTGYTSARFGLELLPPWPFPGFLEYEARLEEASLWQSFTATDPGGTGFPFGFGWHPWFRRDLGDGPAVLHVPGQEISWELDGEMSPTGRQLAPEGPEDLRAPVTPEPGSLDHCFRVTPGSTAKLSWPGGPALSITSSENVSHLQVYTPEHAVCVEPQTCAVDAFRLAAEGHDGTGALMVTGSGSATGWTRWSWG